MDSELPEDQSTRIEGTSFVMLTIAAFERLLQDARASEKSLSVPPQYLNLTDPHEERPSHVVLFAEDHSRMEFEAVPRENMLYMEMPRKDIFARGFLDGDGGMWLLRGSEIGSVKPSMPKYARRARAKLKRDGALANDGAKLF